MVPRDDDDVVENNDELEEKCPNCGNPIAWEDVCAECGYVLDEDEDDDEAGLEEDLDVDEDDEDYDLDDIERDTYELDEIDDVDSDSYDEDEDDVHPKDFHEDFKLSEKIALVLKHDGGILRLGNNSWPRSIITGKPRGSDSNAATYTREVIRRVWGDDVEEDEEERVVGKVGYSEITRCVTIFRPAEEEPV